MIATSKRVLRSYLANSNKGQVSLETETIAVMPQDFGMVYCYGDGSLILREDDGNGGDTLRALSAKEAGND